MPDNLAAEKWSELLSFICVAMTHFLFRKSFFKPQFGSWLSAFMFTENNHKMFLLMSEFVTFLYMSSIFQLSFSHCSKALFLK